MTMDVVDYKIFGDDMQYVEIELDPGEAAIGEAGARSAKGLCSGRWADSSTATTASPMFTLNDGLDRE